MKGNSERVPNKNMRDFHGAPLYHTVMKPLLRSETINKAIENLYDFDFVFGVMKEQIQFYDKNAQPINHYPKELLMIQDFKPFYEENSNFYIFSKQVFENADKKCIGLKPQIFKVNKLEIVDIDEPKDFELAETSYKQKQK